MKKTSEQAQSNPLREGIVNRSVPDAVHGRHLRRDGRSDASQAHSRALQHRGRWRTAAAGRGGGRGAAREDRRANFAPKIGEAVRKFSRQTVRDEIWDGFAKSLFYHISEFGDAEGFKRLGTRLDEIEKERGSGGNRLFYLAVAPDQFEPILETSEGRGIEQAGGRRVGARDRGETVRHRSRHRRGI